MYTHQQKSHEASGQIKLAFYEYVILFIVFPL